MKDEMELIQLVKQKYEEYPAKKINRVWLTHMLVMNEILKDYGGNNFKIPHMNKEKLEADNRLPWILTVDAVAMEKLKGHGWNPPTEDHSIQGQTMNGRPVTVIQL